MKRLQSTDLPYEIHETAHAARKGVWQFSYRKAARLGLKLELQFHVTSKTTVFPRLDTADLLQDTKSHEILEVKPRQK